MAQATRRWFGSHDGHEARYVPLTFVTFGVSLAFFVVWALTHRGQGLDAVGSWALIATVVAPLAVYGIGRFIAKD